MGASKRRTIISLTSQGQNPPYLLFNLLFFVLLANFCCLAELPHFINYPNFPMFSVGLEVILAILLFLVGGTLVFLSRVYFKVRINPILLGAFGLLSLFAVIGTFSIPESVEIPMGPTKSSPSLWKTSSSMPCPLFPVSLGSGFSSISGPSANTVGPIGSSSMKESSFLP